MDWAQRVFHGMKLSASWVKARCIDFTFVGKEFLPNPRAMERVLAHTPKPVSASSAEAEATSYIPAVSGAAAAATTAPTRQILPHSSLSEPHAATATTIITRGDSECSDDEGDEDEMLVDQRARLKKNIDLSEVTYYKVPRYLLPTLHGEGGETMQRFQDYTGTYIVLPSHASVEAAAQSRRVPDHANLSIYGCGCGCGCRQAVLVRRMS